MTQAHRAKTFSCDGLLSGPDQKTGGTGKPAPRGPSVTQSRQTSGSFYSVSPGGSSSPVLADSGAGVGRPSRHAEIPAGAPGCTEGDSLDLRAGETSPAFSEGDFSGPAFLGGIDPVVFRKRDAKAFYEGCAAAGLTKTETARLGGVSLQSVMQCAERYELTFAKAERDAALDDAVVTLHRDGMMLKDVAERLDVTVNSLRRISERLELRWRGSREAGVEPRAAPRKVSENIGQRLRMDAAKAKLTEKQLRDFNWLMKSHGYGFVEALRGVGRYDLAARLEAGK